MFISILLPSSTLKVVRAFGFLTVILVGAAKPANTPVVTLTEPLPAPPSISNITEAFSGFSPISKSLATSPPPPPTTASINRP